MTTASKSGEWKQPGAFTRLGLLLPEFEDTQGMESVGEFSRTAGGEGGRRAAGENRPEAAHNAKRSYGVTGETFRSLREN